MSTVYIVGEIGSCHNGKLDYCKEAIRIAKDIGMDCLKFQLFEEEYAKNGNVSLPRHYWPELVAYAGDKKQPITASAFDLGAIKILNATPNLPFIKFAYSQRFQYSWFLECEHPVMVSCDVLSVDRMPPKAKKLYCISEYPVRYEIAFDGLFPRFDGFSDHTLGWRQTRKAVDMGAQIIEKHFTLNHNDIVCPDSTFALKPEEFDAMVTELRR